jgi:steroid 5-alpha reductase family enzyme
MFVVAQVLKNNSIVDIGWGIGFIIVTMVTFFAEGDDRFHQKLVSYLIIVWALRLSIYIGIRNIGQPEDFRYANWRKEWGSNFLLRSFLQVFMLQGLIMFINTLPIVVVNTDLPLFKSYKVLYPVGVAVWVVGFFFEALGDYQMYMFRCNRHPHKNKIMNKGLWRYTRHPNYFGEAVMWWGIFLLAIPSGRWYISVWAPVTITFLLLKVSGVTMLEKKYDGNDEYSAYKRNTNSFLPWFPKN